MLGSSPEPEFHSYGWNFGYRLGMLDDGIMLLDSDSALRSQLTREDRPMTIILSSDVPCSGDECNVESLMVVQIEEDPPLYYEYVRPKCVELSFYDNAKKIKDNTYSYAMCGNPQNDAAFSICCANPDHEVIYSDSTCIYDFERTTFSKAESRCEAVYDRGAVCDFHYAMGGLGCSVTSLTFLLVS